VLGAIGREAGLINHRHTGGGAFEFRIPQAASDDGGRQLVGFWLAVCRSLRGGLRM